MYSTISNLGKAVDYHTEQADPLTYCLYPNYNSQWIHGSTTTNLLNSPQCTECQLYMSERCAMNWDEACDVYYRNNQDTFWPNLGAVDLNSQKRANHFLSYTPTTGENMIRNTIEKRFFVYPGAAVSMTPFDPNMASSPFITKIQPDTMNPKWFFHPLVVGTVHDQDHYTNLMLDNSKPCFDLIARFHKLYTEQPQMFTKLTGTTTKASRLETFLKENHNIFQAYHNRS